MNINFKQSFVLLCVTLPLLAACDLTGGKKDYAYFRKHIDEAKSTVDQCQINGTSGMAKDKMAQCDAARDAYANRNYAY